MIGHKTINNPEIFSGVHGFTGMTVITIFHILKTHKKITVSNKSKKRFQYYDQERINIVLD